MKSPEFFLALDYVLKYEGAYSNNPADKGGETYCGISRVAYPNWLGWSHIDANKDHLPIAVLNTLVEDFYVRIWNDLQLDYYRPELSTFVFDMAVNCGTKTAVKTLQTALNAVGASLVEDGIMGEKTKIALSHFSGNLSIIVSILQTLRTKLYLRIVEANPSQKIFLFGWLKRTYGI